MELVDIRAGRIVIDPDRFRPGMARIQRALKHNIAVVGRIRFGVSVLEIQVSGMWSVSDIGIGGRLAVNVNVTVNVIVTIDRPDYRMAALPGDR